MAKKFKTWDSYTKEAKKPPFPIEISKEQTLFVKQPTGGTLMDLEQMLVSGSGSTRLVLELILGEDNWKVMDPLITDAPFPAMQALVEDIGEHFDIEALTDKTSDGDAAGEGTSRT